MKWRGREGKHCSGEEKRAEERRGHNMGAAEQRKVGEHVFGS